MRRSEVYTVRELKKALENMPDDLPVVIDNELKGVATYASYDKEQDAFCIEVLDERMEDEQEDWYDPDAEFEREREERVFGR
jgi:hypothetical protein